MNWGFYGRDNELAQLDSILNRRRWAFVKVTGRRRIGKTSLIEEALNKDTNRRSFYVQIPDSEPAGVLASVHEYMEVQRLGNRKPHNLLEFAQLIADLVTTGHVVALDEFQYFHRKALFEFNSHLQGVVDRMSARAQHAQGALIVLGSIQTEMNALLDDRSAPLFNRVTDRIDLGHLDIAAVLEILRTHASGSPQDLLFHWNLFEGVPKFYRDCFEQGVLGKDRREVLRKMFFESSSPLRGEAENWFLHELRGRYDMALKHIAQNPGCGHGDIVARIRELDPEKEKQASGYLDILRDKFRMIERRQPIFAKPNARSGRYYIADNFLRTWLHALAIPAASIRFRPVGELVAHADSKCVEAEGHGLERLVATLYEERSRKGLPGFSLSKRIEGFWDKGDVEIDMVALNEPDRIIRFCSCKRDAERHTLSELDRFDGHISRFLTRFPTYTQWSIERCAIALEHSVGTANDCASKGYVVEDIAGLISDL